MNEMGSLHKTELPMHRSTTSRQCIAIKDLPPQKEAMEKLRGADTIGKRCGGLVILLANAQDS